MAARECGIDLIPVWNKSNREHTFTGSAPASVREAADAAVRALGWHRPYHVDADHINIETVERFLDPSDFFTIDVARFIGATPERNAVEDFIMRHPELTGTIEFPGLTACIRSTADLATRIACKYLAAVQEAGRIYRQAYQQSQALCQPYAAVIDIAFDKLPHPDRVDEWDANAMAAAIRHEPDCKAFDRNVRQLLHVGFKTAAKMGARYMRLLEEYEPFISRNVPANLLQRHMLPLWGK